MKAVHIAEHDIYIHTLARMFSEKNDSRSTNYLEPSYHVTQIPCEFLYHRRINGNRHCTVAGGIGKLQRELPLRSRARAHQRGDVGPVGEVVSDERHLRQDQHVEPWGKDGQKEN